MRGPARSGIIPCTNIVCGHPTRPSQVKSHQAPGTRVRAGQGLCDRCYRKRDDVSHPTTENTTPLTQEMIMAREQGTRRGFERFVAARRARRVPVEGTWTG